MNNENYELQQRQQSPPPQGPSSEISKKGIMARFRNSTSKTAWRPLVAYWLLGLCNNYGYVVMLTAANDILSEDSEESSSSSDNPERDCNYMSTGAILLADILPSLLIKITAPFLPFFVNIRVGICVLLAMGGFLTVAYSSSQWLSILGVVATSFASGLGEITFLQYSTNYNKNVVSTWSSGTGGAGIIGAFSYVALQILGTRTALLTMTAIPVLMGITFWIILSEPTNPNKKNNEDENDKKVKKLSFKGKVFFIPKLLKFMIPLGLVYLLEYFINQGMFELIDFENIFLDKSSQYRWLQVDYQLGVFLSRSSVNIIHIRKIWLMAVFQLINVIYFTTEVIFYYTPSFWIVLVITLWEGLLGGAAYVNTFYRVSTEIPEEQRHFAMGITTFSDSVGIALAGVLAIVTHNQICALPKPERLG